jgi:hypothetical protein
MKALLWLWQAPQHIIALIYWGILRLSGKVEEKTEKGPEPGSVIIRYKNEIGRGCNLGLYSFLRLRHKSGGTAEAHECKGHARQSQMLGPMYLLVVGIYSACLTPCQNIFMKGASPTERDKWYYSRWTEGQNRFGADRLGGVVRVYL